MASHPELVETRLLDPKCLGAPLLGIDALADRSELQLIEAGPSMRAGPADIILPGTTTLDFFGALKSYDDVMSQPGPKFIKITADELKTVSRDIAALSDLSANELKNLSAQLPPQPWGDLTPVRKQVDQALARLAAQGRRIKIPATRGRLLGDSALESLLNSSDFLDQIDASRNIKERAELIALLRKQIDREPNRYIRYLDSQAVTFKRIARGLAGVKYVLVVAPIAPALYDVHANWDDPNARGKALEQLARLGTKTAAETALDLAVDIAVPAIALALVPAGGFFVAIGVLLGLGIAGAFLVESISDAIFKGEQIDRDLSVLP